jgi:hypothetical protein
MMSNDDIDAIRAEHLAGLRDGELRLRRAGLFDAADMYRCLADGFERGAPSDLTAFDRGRIDHIGPMFGLEIGQLPSGYGRCNVNDPPEPDRLPQSNAEIVELAKYCKFKWTTPDAHQMFVSYLITHGFGRLRVRNVLMPVWEEAAKCVELQGEELHRATMLMTAHRTRYGVMGFLDCAVHTRELSEASAELLLEEWDALHFPNQLPEPVRERALRRHRFAIGESDAQ